MCVGAFMGQLDASIVTIALPTLSRDLRAPLGAVEWVVLAYLVVLVAAVMVAGRVADRVGRRRLYLAGFAVFGVASAGCAAAPTLAVLVCARLVQGAGAVLLQANSVALVRDALPQDKIGVGIGVQGAAQAVGLAAGPAVGGALIAAAGWRLLFLVNVPVCVAGIAAGLLLLPPGHPSGRSERIDLLGAALLAATTGGFVATLSLLAVPAAPRILALAPAAVTVVAAAAAWQRQRAVPGALVEEDLLARRAFLTGGAAALLAYSMLFGVLVLVPFLLESRGSSALGAGLQLTVLPLTLGVVAPAGGRIADRRGARLPATLGMALAVAGLVLVAALPATAAARPVALLLVGCGLGLFIPAMNASIMRAAPPGRTGAAAGGLNLVRGLGTAAGVAVSAAALAASGVQAGFLLLAAAAAGAGIIAAVRRPARADAARFVAS